MDAILQGFYVLSDPFVLGFLTTGVVLGLLIGAIPGLNDNITFAVFIPFVFGMEASHALALMVGVYCSTSVGGAIPAIMLKVPGTASSLLTSIDGNAMTRQGKAPQALSVAITSSVVGGLTSSVVLIFFAPLLAAFALRFGPAENVALGILGLASVVGMMSGSIFKGLIAAAFGLLISSVGYHYGQDRLTFDNFYFYDGVPLVPLLVGLFGITAVLELVEEDVAERLRGNEPGQRQKDVRAVILDSKMVKRLWPTWLRSSAIGNIIGVIPGAGALMAIYISYDQARRHHETKYQNDPDEPKFGEGAVEGVAAPEAANNAVVASSMVPLLSLGIPGNSVSALFIAAMQIKGLAAGPLLFQRNIDIVWMIILAFFAANLMMGPIAYITVRWLISLIYALPRSVLATAVALLCLTGAYAVESTMFGVWVALVFGIVGYGFRKAGVPIAPVILAVILGERIESSLYNALQLSGGNWFTFIDPLGHPISLLLLVVSAGFLASPLIKRWRTSRAR
ncbi:hypothetical protein GCM10007989_34350 [Devosia pacifica]|uniref:DUF112 domain-containing protein n=1 Tax=Devosia pacifica TaxID=1335967 RepID=A0A918SD87_9HYPH|nr:tripartite tricarboxylate transporter permease [Devosia pacifica]GHA35521.1 hypothetical protein GCM10007989_34350 [Devosia pacifica]